MSSKTPLTSTCSVLISTSTSYKVVPIIKVPTVVSLDLSKTDYLTLHVYWKEVLNR